jgi:hypothetical protein
MTDGLPALTNEVPRNLSYGNPSRQPYECFVYSFAPFTATWGHIEGESVLE